ncbi:MAG: carboxypeptidase regulatory-like domain-containing protein, partial [Myxococcales bacterium]|nr:carboxypeptidase regulatory-like domain-containing protein [Myxococcales bacterium]
MVPGCAGLSPEAPGDACDPDGDPCPTGSVCAPGGDDHICQTEPGQPCDPNGEDFCLGDSVCTETAEGGGICGIPEGGECDPEESYCTGDLLCEPIVGGGHACYPAVTIAGRVFDAQTDAAVQGAHVIAFDESATAVSDVAVSGPDGDYSLVVPMERQTDGTPSPDAIITLRASAADYLTFPGGVRTALPISGSEAMASDPGWTIQSAVTDVALLPLPSDQQGRTTIEGRVVAGDLSAGVLVVAESGGAGISAVSDKSGAYTIFNVPDGSYEVKGYAAGVQLVPEAASVSGMPVLGVDLGMSQDALGSISGNIQIVNAPGGATTSVVLVVASTFSETFVKGEVPRGLRAPLSGPPTISGDFHIEGVPAGEYVVLASFENDDLVR